MSSGQRRARWTRSIVSLIASRTAAAASPHHTPATMPRITPAATIAMSQMT